MTIYEKLSQVQKELIAPKGKKNDFGGFNYRSCEDILKNLKPLCEKVGALVYITNDLIHEGDFNYQKATAVFQDLESEKFILSSATAREDAIKKGSDGSQISGSASSYARKTALAGLFCIDNEKDADTPTKETKKKATTDKPSDKKIEMVKAYCNAMNYTFEYLCETNNVKPEDVTETMCSNWIDGFKKKGVMPKW